MTAFPLPTVQPAYVDPRTLGADCEKCILQWDRDGDPVFAELTPGAIAIVVAEAPGKDEVEHGSPLIGASGRELMSALELAGMHRRQLSFTNAALCKPPGNEWAPILAKLRRTNEYQREKGLPEYPTPMQCCRPRLLREVRQYNKVIVLGGMALKSLTGIATGILDVRGGPISGALTGGGGVAEDGSYAPDDNSNDGARFLRDMVGARADNSDAIEQVGHRLNILPTVHPAFVIRARRWTKVFRSDIARAARWFATGLAWKDPAMLFTPTPDQLKKFLLRWDRLVFDVETEWTVNGIRRGPTEARIRCIGLGNEYAGVIVPFVSIDGRTRFYNETDYAEIRSLVAQWLASSRAKWGWNSGYYDRLSVESDLKDAWIDMAQDARGIWQRRVVPWQVKNSKDGILFHRGVDPELPHTLAFVGSMETDVHSWKAGHTATEARTDEELFRYCALDLAVTATVITPLVTMCAARKQTKVVAIDHMVQRYVCADLHRIGMRVDQRRRHLWELVLREKAKRLLATLRAHTEAAGFRPLKRKGKGSVANDYNPNSTHHLKKLLFSHWRLPPVTDARGRMIATESGEPSTSDDVLLALRQRGDLSPYQIGFIDKQRKFRKTTKLIGTYLLRMKPRVSEIELDNDPLAAIDVLGELGIRDRNWDELTKDERAPFLRGLVRTDGRVHADWNCHTPKTRRLSSSNMNLQNLPRALRSIFVPEANHIFVGIDADALEMKLICAAAGAKRYLEVFKTNGDPHALAAEMVFGEKFTKAARCALGDKCTGKECNVGCIRYKIRTFVKRFVYSAAKGGKEESILRAIQSVENHDGSLVYPDVTLSEVRNRRAAWLGANPEIEVSWATTLTRWRRDGFLTEPIHGHRLDFLDGENENVQNEIIAFEAQAGGAAYIHDANLELVAPSGGMDAINDAPLRYEFAGPNTGQVGEFHDAFLFEVPLSRTDNDELIHAKWAAGEMNRAMRRRYPCYDVQFTGKAKIGKTWAAV